MALMFLSPSFIGASSRRGAPCSIWSIFPDRCVASRRSEEHTSELQSRLHLVCRLLLEKKKNEDQKQHKVALREAGAPPGPPLALSPQIEGGTTCSHWPVSFITMIFTGQL